MSDLDRKIEQALGIDPRKIEVETTVSNGVDVLVFKYDLTVVLPADLLDMLVLYWHLHHRWAEGGGRSILLWPTSTVGWDSTREFFTMAIPATNHWYARKIVTAWMWHRGLVVPKLKGSLSQWRVRPGS